MLFFDRPKTPILFFVLPTYGQIVQIMNKKNVTQLIGLFLLLGWLPGVLQAQADPTEPLNEGDQYYQRGKSVLRKGDIDSMAYYWNRAIDVFKQVQDIEGLYNCYFGFSSVYMQLGQLEKAMTYSDSTFWVAVMNEPESDLYKEHLTYAHYRRGNLHNLSFSFELAIEDYRQAVHYELIRMKPDSNHLSRTWNNLATLYRNAGDYKKALDSYQYALNYGDAISWSVKAAILNNLGHLYFDEGDFPTALRFFQRAHLSFKENTEINNLKLSLTEVENYVNVCNNLGKTYDRIGDFAQAEMLLKKSLQLQQEYKFDASRLFTYRYLGQLYLQQKSFLKQGIGYLEKSLVLAKERFAPPNRDLGTSYYVLGKAFHQLDDIKTALNFYAQARKSLFQAVSQEQRLPTTPIEVLAEVTMLKILVKEGEALWKYYQKQQDREALLQGLDNFAFMDRLITQMRRGYLSQESKQFLATQVHQAYGVAIRIAQALYVATQEERYADAALNFFENSKAMILLESLETNDSQMFQDLRTNTRRKALLAQEAALKAKMANYKRLIYEAKQDEKKIKEWSQLLFETNQEFETIQTTFEEEYPEYFALKYASNTLTLQKVKEQLLNNGELILEYYMDTTILLTCVVGSDIFEIKAREIDASDLRMINAFLNEVSNFSFYKNAHSSFTDFWQSSFQVYELLLKHILEKVDLPLKELIIVPDGILNVLPFTALTMGKPVNEETPNYGPENMEYVLERYEIRYAYSLKSLLYYQERLLSNSAKSLFAGFAPSFKGPLIRHGIRSCANNQLSDLKYTSEEVRTIAEELDGDFFLGAKASSERFKNLVGDYQILHLATHACVNPDDPLYGKIFFGPEDYLYTLDLYGLSLRADLVVLSACETGVGSILSGEGVQSLARALAYGGCPSTLTSLWSIADRTTADLMIKYYMMLQEGHAKSTSLRETQLQFLHDQKTAQQHPVYWAGFTQIGANDPIDLSAKRNLIKGWYFFAAILLLSVGGWLFARNRHL